MYRECVLLIPFTGILVWMPTLIEMLVSSYSILRGLRLPNYVLVVCHGTTVAFHEIEMSQIVYLNYASISGISAGCDPASI